MKIWQVSSIYYIHNTISSRTTLHKAAIFLDDINSQSKKNVTNAIGNSSQADAANNLDSSQWDLTNSGDSVVKITKGSVYKRMPKASRLQASMLLIKLSNV